MHPRARCVLIAAALSAVLPHRRAVAQISLTGTNPTVTENFDEIGNASNATLPAGWKVDSASTTTVYTGAVTTVTRAIGVSGAGPLNSSSPGGTYNFSSTDNNGTDRAIGWLTSGTYHGPRQLFAAFTNNTGSGITDLSLQYDIESYRNGSGHNFDIDFFYSYDGQVWTSATSNTLTNESGTNVIISPPSTLTVPVILSNIDVVSGGSFYLRWQYRSSDGNYGSAQALGIDNFALTATTGTLASDNATVFWNPRLSTGGGSEGSGTWDSTTANWFSSTKQLNTPWNDSTPDNAVFGVGAGPGGAVVTLGSDHTAGAITFSAGSQTYTLTSSTLTLTGNSLQSLVSPGSLITAQQNATINSNLVLAVSSGSPGVNISAGATLLLNGAVSGTTLIKNGDGTLCLTDAGNSFDHLELNAGTVQFSGASQLGANGPLFNTGTVQNTVATSLSSNVTAGGPITIDTSAGDLTFAGRLIGTGSITKIGGNAIVLDNPAPVFKDFSGAITLNSGTLKVQTSNGAPNFDTQTGSAAITVNTGATFELDNVQQGTAESANHSTVTLNAGATLLSTGNSIFDNGEPTLNGGDTATSALKIANGTSDAPLTVNIATTAATDTLTLENPIRQVDAAVTATFTTININGPGRVILASGIGTSHTTTAFAGSWAINSGYLQLGPIRQNSLPANTSEPLLALGVNNGVYTRGVPVTINPGGTLLIADDAANSVNVVNSATAAAGAIWTNPYTTATVILNGGSVASSNFEIDANGNPTSTPVSAQLGGPFTVTSGRVLTYDPVASNNISANTISLVANGGTTWSGNLTIDPGGHAGGAFVINRDYSTSAAVPVSVSPGSTIAILPGATLQLTGSAALTDGVNSVNITNNSNLDVEPSVIGATQIIGNLTGSGATTVAAGATLSVGKTSQNAITVNGVMLVHPGATAIAATVSSLTVGDNTAATTGKLDLTNNDLILLYSGISPLPTITALLSAGCNNGAWNGNGIASSIANSTPFTALGVGDAAQLGITSLDGNPITGDAVIVRYTLVGDSTLDGKVDLGNDFNLFLQGFLGLGTGWIYGDYDYSTATDLIDFQSFIDGFAASGGDLGNLTAVIETQNGLSAAQKSTLISMVPEPSFLTLLPLVFARFTSKRWRKR